MSDPSSLRPIAAVAERAREDSILAFLASKPPRDRKAYVMALRADGLISNEEVAFWFYVFALGAE